MACHMVEVLTLLRPNYTKTTVWSKKATDHMEFSLLVWLQVEVGPSTAM